MKKRYTYHKISILLLLLISINVSSLAQTGKITGLVKSVDDKPLEAATVFLKSFKDSALVKIALTDKNGIYEFDKIRYGQYLLQVELMGYELVRSKAFELTEQKRSIQLDDIKPGISSKSLAAVSVTAKRPLIENRIDMTVVNVEASTTNSGLTALEILEKSPGVTVDNNGNISLKGKQGVIILIDGKPTYLSGENLTNYLKNLSSNQLDQIEIMSQPSAKYDASGNSGVINIKTKKNRSFGLNGNISISAIIAKYFKNTNSININFHQGKVNLFGNYSNSFWEGFNEIHIDRDLRAARDLAFDRYVRQSTFGRYSGRPQNYKIGIDYFANKKTTLGMAVTGGVEDDKFRANSRADIYDGKLTFVQYNNAISETHNPWNNFGINLNMQQKLDTSGQELSADADYISYRTKGNQFSYNYLYDANNVLSEDPYLLNGYLPANIDIYTFKSDYKRPFQKGLTLEAGVKTSYVKTDNDAQYTRFNTPAHAWDTDTSRSNHFIYKENINAAYINLQKQMKKWGLQVGLRAEQTIAEGNQVTKFIAFKKNYTKLFPTTYLSYNLSDKNTFSLSYGRRIERPGYQSLNPFQYQLDRYTYEQGNPDLQPQFSHNIELSYNYKGQLNLSVNYTSVTDIINDVLITKKQPGDSNYTTYQTTLNIASSKNVGFSANFNKQLKKWWSLNVFANLHNNQYNGVIDNENIRVSYTSINANLNSQFTFNKGWSAELSGFFNGKQLVSSAIFAYPMGMFSAGATKQILNKKGSIRLNLRDPFYLMHFKGSTDLSKGVTHVMAHWDNRRYIITFTYRFGKNGDQQPRRRTSGADDEKSRINTGGQQ
jgi:outer membrane receptor protein involved in Fe transport